MTDALLRRGHEVLTPVQRRDLPRALALCARDPVSSVVPAMHLETASRSGVIPTGLWAVRQRGAHEIAGVVWSGANLTAVLPSDDVDDADDLRADLAEGILERLVRPAALVGEAGLTLDLWGRLEHAWGPARQERIRQVSMVMTGDPVTRHRQSEVVVEPLRRSVMSDYPDILPAAVHMFIGEVGYDPLLHGRDAYEDRLRHLIRRGRSYVQFGLVDGERTVVFKAEVGVVGLGVAQVQGVWVHPDVRGLGLGAASMADLVRHVRADHARTVSLYVNDFNEAAVRMYDAVGFTRVGHFATIMF
jgi:predicted GNAT family acetyltransferase